VATATKAIAIAPPCSGTHPEADATLDRIGARAAAMKPAKQAIAVQLGTSMLLPSTPGDVGEVAETANAVCTA